MTRFLLIVGLLMPVSFAQAQVPASSARPLTSGDTAAVLRSAWYAVSGGHLGHRTAVLSVPSMPDSAESFSLSPEVRDRLVRLGIPASERRPAGDDTVVFRVIRWRSDTLGELVRFHSTWTEVHGGGARRCRTSSGNVETVRVRPQNGGWEVAPEPRTALHGDAICRPIVPGPPEPAPDDTLAIELVAISHMVGSHSGGGRLIALDPRFANPGQAPPSMSSRLRPAARQSTLTVAISAEVVPAPADTLNVHASPPRFSGSTATIWITVGHKGRAPTANERRRRAFYQTVEYFLRRESGKWVITGNTTHGIS